MGTQVQIYNPELVLVWSAVVSNLKERVRNVYAPPHSPVSDGVGRRVLLHPLLVIGPGVNRYGAVAADEVQLGNSAAARPDDVKAMLRPPCC